MNITNSHSISGTCLATDICPQHWEEAFNKHKKLLTVVNSPDRAWYYAAKLGKGSEKEMVPVHYRDAAYNLLHSVGLDPKARANLGKEVALLREEYAAIIERIY